MAKTVKVTENSYWSMLNDFLFPKMDEKDLENIWFQQDSHLPYIQNKHLNNLNNLKQTFNNKVISRNVSVNWLLCSIELTCLDFFLWGYVKVQLSANKAENFEAFKNKY